VIDRRRFLGGVVGLALGSRAVLGAAGGSAARTAPQRPRLADDPAYRQYLADIAGCDRRVLGVSRCRLLVEEGFHPVAPGRVIVIDDAELRRFGDRLRGLKRRFRQEEARWRERWPLDPPLPPEKLDLCVGLMDRLTSHYGRPDLLGRWARTLWAREQLGSTGIGHGLGLLHDFQAYNSTVRTDNGLVDWWLVLLPAGMDWRAIDDAPVYYMVGPVMEERQPGSYLRVMEGISRSLRHLVMADGFDPSVWATKLAGLPAAEAAREVNHVVARYFAAAG
jgi:hypothetical protein